jgi:hypothetical protein
MQDSKTQISHGNAKEFLRKLPKIWARTFVKVCQLCLRGMDFEGENWVELAPARV